MRWQEAVLIGCLTASGCQTPSQLRERALASSERVVTPANTPLATSPAPASPPAVPLLTSAVATPPVGIHPQEVLPNASYVGVASHQVLEGTSPIAGGSSTGPTALATVQSVGRIQPPSAVPPDASREESAAVPADASPRRSEEDVPVPPARGEVPTVQLQDVVSSVLSTFPLIQIALLENEVAEGKRVAAWGEFDLKVKAEGLAAPQGYYQNYRNQVKLEQGTWNGGTLFGQYRIGDGDFAPWYGERETNEGGEFKAGLISPLLRDRAIDERRAEILLAQYRQAQVEPAVQAQILEATQLATRAYWSWLGAGRAFEAQEELLRLTRERNQGVQRRVELQDLPAIELLQNERLIASREAKLIEARRKVQQAAIKLSLFLRTDDGLPIVPQEDWLPEELPEPSALDESQLEADVQAALEQRPEPRDLALQREQATIELAAAENQLLPALNATLEASQDVGRAASSKGDKSPFELEAGLLFDLPVQRRKAYGKITAVEGKLSQIAAKQQFVENKIRAEIQDTYSALAAAYQKWRRAADSQQLARQLEVAERRRFELGESDLLRVALQESASLDAVLLTIEAQLEYLYAQADYQAALGQTAVLPTEVP